MNKIGVLLLLASCSAYGMEKSFSVLQLQYIHTFKQNCNDEGYNFDHRCELKMKEFLVSPEIEKVTFYGEIAQHMQMPINIRVSISVETMNTFTTKEQAEIFKDRRI